MVEKKEFKSFLSMKNNKEIFVVANGIIGENPGLSGGDMRFFKILYYWQKKGYRIHILSSESINYFCKMFNISAIIHVIKGTKGSERSAYIFRFFQSLFYLPKTISNLDKFIIYSVNDSLFDVIPAFKLKIKYKNKSKWAAVIHWIPPFPPWKRKGAKFLNSILFFVNVRISVWLASKFSDVLLAVSNSTFNQLKSIGVNINKIRVVKCGVDLDQAEDFIKTTKKYDAIFMKRAQVVKGAYDLVHIWREVVMQKKDAKLLIAGGDGRDEKALKKAFKEANLLSNVVFLGYVFDSKEKYQRLAQSRLMLLPSYEENWAIVVGEAFGVGTPVIAYKLPELVEVWKDNVYWIDIGQFKDFANKILSLLDAKSELAKMSEKNRSFIRFYDWSFIAEEELAAIEGID